MSDVLWGKDEVIEPNRHIDIINELRTLDIPYNFKIIDIACGDGAVLKEIVKAFPSCSALGIDIADYGWSEPYFQVGSVQQIIEHENCYDVVLMLSSYRNWRGTLKDKFDNWVRSSHFITSLAIKVIGKDSKNYPLVRYQIGTIE